MSRPAPARRTRCLLLSYVFPPSVGGIEFVSELVASMLAERDYEIHVLTRTPAPPGSDEDSKRPYRVCRRPSAATLLHELNWADVVLQANASLRLAWPLALLRFPRPWVLVHHTPLSRPRGALTLRDRLKRRSLAPARNYAVSRYLAATLPVPAAVLYNPYDDRCFRLTDGIARDTALLFVGRLVPAKGVDILLRALAQLAAESAAPRLTIVGTGPSDAELRALTSSLNLERQVAFVGSKFGSELAALMNAHQVLVVPSRAAPPEALGVVSLEAIACGCVVIAANQGGLPESVGPCGVTFRSESPEDLAATIRRVLLSEEIRLRLTAGREGFLAPFRRASVVQGYLQALDAAVADFARAAKIPGDPQS